MVKLCIFAPAVFAFDVGLVFEQEAEYSGAGDDTSLLYKGILVPRISGLLGSNGEFIISAGLNYQNDPWAVVPELLHTGLSFGFDGADFDIGRMLYSDPLGFIADGLFDGARLTFDTGAGVFGMGAWYTGLLCKRRANIEMTQKEYDYNNAAIEYSDFMGTYFAPSRVLAALDWEHANITKHFRLKAAILGQFDLTSEELNSQYFIAKMTLPFSGFTLDLGGCFELIQRNSQTGSGEMDMAYAAEAGLSWIWQGQGLSFLARHSSGVSDSVTAFLPLTTVSQGNVISERLSGLTVFSLDYTARLHETLSFSLIPAYFIDNFDSTLGLMGAEIYGKLDWRPVSDIFFTLGGGAFLPSLGDIAPNDQSYWKVEMNVIISLF
ncbi:MAG: hypothetical protein FWH19_06140 [Treponema sp.]|nr:hypothetical protein [Treponema sp.]